MCVCVCVLACVHACVRASVCVCECVCVYVCACAHACVRACVCECVRAACMCVCVRAQVRADLFYLSGAGRSKLDQRKKKKRSSGRSKRGYSLLIFCPTPGFKGSTLLSSGLSTQETLTSVPLYPTAENPSLCPALTLVQ